MKFLPQATASPLRLALLPLLLIWTCSAGARELPATPAALAEYALEPAPQSLTGQLKTGDRLAICGDSITEQRQYSVILEAYLTACVPELQITCRQYGWSGERAAGFLNRMEKDVLRFQPTLATTCYGMNDFRYVPFDPEIGEEYRTNQTAIVRRFKAAGCRVIVGSPGIIDSVPHWVKTATGTQKQLNLALARFRNIALEVAKSEETGFADLYQTMLIADFSAKETHGPDFKVAGKDGVHPGWAGQVLMAYGFLKSMGVDGDLGLITYRENDGTTTATDGHEVLSSGNGVVRLRSSRLPFSPGPGDSSDDQAIRAGLALAPFDDELNRLILKIESPASAAYTVTWGDAKRNYSAAQLVAGINLASDFHEHPLVPAFRKVWDAVTAKQEYETRQIKTLVHGPEGKADLEATFALTEKARGRHVSAVAKALQPTEHEIRITATP
jgi:lysophospholipase L1-like esterase